MTMPYRRRDRRDGHGHGHGDAGAATAASSPSSAAVRPPVDFTAAGSPRRRPSSDYVSPPRRPPPPTAYPSNRGHAGSSSPSDRSPRSARSAAGRDSTSAALPPHWSPRPRSACCAGPSDGDRHGSAPPQALPPSPPPRVVDPPRPPPPRSVDELLFAKRTLRKLARDSRLFDGDDERRVRTVGEKELDVGAVIGRGGFCEVRFADLKRPRSHGVSGHGSGIGCGGRATGEERRRYAMKYLSPAKSASSSRVFQRGLADLATEACFLSLLRHEHVIGLHYVGEGSLEENYGCDERSNGKFEEVVTDERGNLKLRRRSPEKLSRTEGTERLFGYFLLLDPLHETLTDRIEKSYVPRELLGHSESEGTNAYSGREACVSRLQLAERLDVLTSVASALRYLHEECRVVFRDVKPDNIGFYRRPRRSCTCGHYPYGCQKPNDRQRQREQRRTQQRPRPSDCHCHDEVVKLFDFGLAKELKPAYRKPHPTYRDESTYRLTACTGSRRYMAPEVCFGDPYNEKADVYSFGMLAHQTCSLVTPFDGWDAERHEREALRGGGRPDVSIPGRSCGRGLDCTTMVGMDSDVTQNSMSDSERKNRLLASRTKRHWPPELPGLMDACWREDLRRRPKMGEALRRLRTCADSLRGGVRRTGDEVASRASDGTGAAYAADADSSSWGGGGSPDRGRVPNGDRRASRRGTRSAAERRPILDEMGGGDSFEASPEGTRAADPRRSHVDGGGGESPDRGEVRSDDRRTAARSRPDPVGGPFDASPPSSGGGGPRRSRRSARASSGEGGATTTSSRRGSDAFDRAACRGLRASEGWT
ncbi:hypothetical protein ACHAWF_016192 [Thalassiosira exigua]